MAHETIQSDEPLAALWDMDGVLVESARYHYVAWQHVWAERGVKLTEADFRKNFGQRNDTIIHDMLGADVSDQEIKDIGNSKERYYRDAIKGSVEALPGAIGLLKALRQAGFRCAIASAAPRDNVELILTELNAFDLFDALVTYEDVKRGKPDPQVYLLAAERVGIEPERCVVLEDAVAGVEGAKRAGMVCLGVTSNHSRRALAQADLIVDSLEEATPEMLRDLILKRTAQLG